MIRPFLALVLVTAAATAVFAQADAVKTRQGLMDQNQDHDTALFRMTRGEAPFDAARVKAAYAQWEDTAKQLPNLFPQGTEGSPATLTGSAINRASPKIWDDKAGFAAKIAQFAKAVSDQKDKVNTLDDLKVAFGTLDKTCNDCHGSFRLSRRR